VRAGDVYASGRGLMIHVRRRKGGQPREAHVHSDHQAMVAKILCGTQALMVVSQDLGHHRTDIVVRHYTS